jgi:large subunit ribosomal protein L22
MAQATQAFGLKTNERPGTRSVVRYARFSAFKARPVLDLIRGQAVGDADEILQFTPRAAAVVIRKCLASAVANAQHNDELDPDDLYVSACFADEGPTLRRFRPRARGRATRIRKRTCHITVIVSRMPEEMLERQRRRQEAHAPAATRGRRGRDAAAARRERVRRSRRGQEAAETAVDEPPAPADDTDTDAGEQEAQPESLAGEEIVDHELETQDPVSEAADAPAGAAEETSSVADGGAGEAEPSGADDMEPGERSEHGSEEK